MKRLLKRSAKFIARYPYLKRLFSKALNYFPGIKAKVRQWVVGGMLYPRPEANIPTELAHLTPRARHIHSCLHAAIEHHQKRVR